MGHTATSHSPAHRDFPSPTKRPRQEEESHSSQWKKQRFFAPLQPRSFQVSPAPLHVSSPTLDVGVVHLAREAAKRKSDDCEMSEVHPKTRRIESIGKSQQDLRMTWISVQPQVPAQPQVQEPEELSLTSERQLVLHSVAADFLRHSARNLAIPQTVHNPHA